MSIEKRGMHRQRGEVCTWCNLSSTDAVISPAACSMSTLISASVSCVSAEGVCADIRRVCDVVWRRMSEIKCDSYFVGDLNTKHDVKNLRVTRTSYEKSNCSA